VRKQLEEITAYVPSHTLTHLKIPHTPLYPSYNHFQPTNLCPPPYLFSHHPPTSASHPHPNSDLDRLRDQDKKIQQEKSAAYNEKNSMQTEISRLTQDANRLQRKVQVSIMIGSISRIA
jgi:hypothetical protein